MDHCTSCGLPVEASLDDFIVAVIQRSLSINGGNKQKAAKQLGISRSTLYRYLGQSKEVVDAGEVAQQC